MDRDIRTATCVPLPFDMSVDLATLSDDRLVALCLERGTADDRLWTELFRRHRQLVWSVCRRYFRNREDIGDMVQETFLRALRGLERYTGGHPAAFKAWLARIAANHCKNELRRRSRRLQPVDDEVTAEMAVCESTESVAAEIAGRRARLEAALDSLSENERQILQLADLEEQSYREIAGRLDLSLSAVKMRVLRARASLAAAFRALDSKAMPDENLD